MPATTNNQYELEREIKRMLTSSLNALSALNKRAKKITPPRVNAPAAVSGRLRYTLPETIAIIIAVAKLVKIEN